MCPTPDILGVSALVDAINHRNAAGATDSTVLGPFHVNHDTMMPLWGNISEGQAGSMSFVSGKVLDTEGLDTEAMATREEIKAAVNGQIHHRFAITHSPSCSVTMSHAT